MTTHGMAGTPVYLVWQTMRNRCHNPKVKSYKDYGARGIRVCDDWNRSDGFEAFMRDMGPRPDGYQIERRQNDGDYEPSNCFWALRSVQVANKRNNRTLTAFGRTQTLAEWARELDCNPAAILYRIKAGWSEERAVTEPAPERPNGKLTIAQVEQIKARPTDPSTKLATEFGVSKKSILNIRHGRTFNYV